MKEELIKFLVVKKNMNGIIYFLYCLLVDQEVHYYVIY